MKRTIMAAITIVALTISAAASEAAWLLNCKDDPIEDLRSCSLNGETVTVIGIALRNGLISEFVTLGFDRYPGSDFVFRVDQNPPIRWPERETGGRSDELIKEMIEGRTMLARYTKWPYGTTVDGTENLIGFTARLEDMRQRLREYGDRSN
jgi:hypothetical protein